MKWAVLGITMLAAVPVAAQTAANDAQQWLTRISRAAQTMNYSGTFVYQSGNISETSRIVHMMDKGAERARLEVMDGSPRELVTENGEIKCYLPESRTVIVGDHNPGRNFPALLPQEAWFSEYYAFRRGGVERIAGFDAQLLQVDPRDVYRYGHRFWVEASSGLLLRARMLNDKGEAIEQFSFTQLELGPIPKRDALRSRFSTVARDWRIEKAKPAERMAGESEWSFRDEIPGFRKTAETRRRLRQDGPEVIQIVFSDGLAAISVFVEPVKNGTTPETGVFHQGPISVYKRVLADQLVTVLGEVPVVSVRRLGDAIEWRKP